MYGIEGKETFFAENSIQQIIHVWAEIKDFEFAKELKNGIVICKNDSEHIEKSYIVAKEIVSAYYECFNKEQGDNVVISIHGFSEYLKEFAYGHSLSNLRIQLKKKLGIAPENIIVLYEPRLTILCEDDKQYNKFSKKIKKIKKITYSELKNHDKYDILSYEDTDVLLLKKKELSPTDSFVYGKESLTATGY